MLSSENAQTASRGGIIIFIDTPFETCLSRIKSDENRPLAASRTDDGLRELFDVRHPVYVRCADITVSGTGTVGDIADEIMSRL